MTRIATKSEAIVFNGITFRRFPKAKQWSHRVYYTPHAAHRRRGIQALHQEIWKSVYGPIQKGMFVHHVDHNPLNNTIDNLECVTKLEHDVDHSAERRQRTKTDVNNLHAARVAAAAWHRSPEGRRWHKENGKRAWAKRKPITVICTQCGQKYQTLKISRTKFCSSRCRQRAYRDDGRYADRDYVRYAKRRKTRQDSTVQVLTGQVMMPVGCG